MMTDNNVVRPKLPEVLETRSVFAEGRSMANVNEYGADKYGKKTRVPESELLVKMAKEIDPLVQNIGKPPKPTTEWTLTQLIADDMRKLVVQEAYELSEGIVRVHYPDAKDDDLKTKTIELMLTLNKWCLGVDVPGEP